MLGLFNLFGRSDDLKALDQELREAGLHPRIVPEAVKLTIVRLLKDQAGPGARISDADFADAAMLLGYCMLGPDQFAASTSLTETGEVENRVEAAITRGTGFDASILLLSHNAGLIHAELADRFEVETG